MVLNNTYLGFCKLALIIFSLAYLAVEIHFNVTLLDVVAMIDADQDLLHDVEEFGRRASSSGFALFALGLFVSTGFMILTKAQWYIFMGLVVFCTVPFLLTSYHTHTLIYVFVGASVVVTANRFRSIAKYKLPRTLIGSLGLIIMSWMAFYNGKMALIEHFVIDQSTGEERLSARYVPIVRSGLADGSLVLQDISIEDFGGAQTPEAKAFLVMMGPLVLKAQSLTNWARDDDNMVRVVRTVMSSNKIVDVRAEYLDYLSHRKAFQQDYYAPYAKSSKEYLERGNQIKSRAEKEWLLLQKEIDASWVKFKGSRENYLRRHQQKARDSYADRLNTFFDRRSACHRKRSGPSRQRCLKAYDEKYNKEMSQVISPPPPWQIFCDQDTSAQAVINDVVGALNAILSFGSVKQGKQYVCLNSADAYGKRMAVYAQKKFIRSKANVLGLPFSLDKVKYVPLGEEAFLNSPELQRYIRRKLGERDIKVAANWNIYDAQGFYRAFKKKANTDAKAKWNREIKAKLGSVVKAGLSMDHFTRLPAVQKYIKSELGEKYIPGFIFSWSEKAFAAKVLQPKIEQRINDEISLFKSSAQDFDNGMTRTEEGKDWLRLALVPAIAVSLSLFFSFLSASKIVVSVLALFVEWKIERKQLKKRLLIGAWVLSMLVVAAMPYMFSNQYAQSEGWEILSEDTAKVSPALTVMVEYTIRVQPVLADLSDWLGRFGFEAKNSAGKDI